MLIPFLPYLLAVAGLTALLALPGTAVSAPAWAMAALYLALPLLGGIVGQLPERWMGGRRQAPLRRRMLFLTAWLALLTLLTLPAGLAAALAWSGDGQTAALVLLLLNFWLGDTLAVCPLLPVAREAWPEQLRRFSLALRMPVPILILMGVGLVLPVVSGDLLPGAEGSGQTLPWLHLLASMGAMLLLAMVAVPVLIRVCWGLRPLPDGPTARLVHEELAANGVPVAAVLAWPDEMLGSATAGVIGLLPRLRYLLISPTLAAALDPEELRSVTAHEAGHLVHRHLWYFLAAILAFVLAMQFAATGLFWGALLTGAQPPLWLLIGLEVGALVLFFRFGIGYLSRHFERQADGNALRRLGPSPFAGAMIKLGLLNGIVPEHDNWHHYGINRRIGFAQRAQAEPGRLDRHDRKVARIKRWLLAVLVIGLGAQAAVTSPDAMGWLGERYLNHRLAGEAQPTAADVLPLQFLATRAVNRGDHAAAERYFRLVLQVTPEDPQAQNNLAWVLVTQPQARPGELREGLALARQAAQAKEQAYIWDTLAESHYRLHEYDAAIHAASKALALAQEGAGRGEVSLRYYRERLAAFSRHGRGA